jgi:hypothetical protein
MHLFPQLCSRSMVMVTFDYFGTLIRRAELLRLNGKRNFVPGRGVRRFRADSIGTETAKKSG